MPAYEVVLLRHGETVGYDADHGLTPLGERQAAERGAALARELGPGATVRMPHARTSRAIATATVLRAALVAALGHEEGIGAPHPEPWFDDLRFALDGRGVGASDAVTARLALDGEVPDWAREYDRFDPDPRADVGDPVAYWLHNPTLWFEPPHVAAHRMWRGIAAAGVDAPEGLRVLVATHSAPMRALVATALGRDPGGPAHLEDVRVRVEPDGAAVVRFRGHVVGMRVPEHLPPWIDRDWSARYGRQ